MKNNPRFRQAGAALVIGLIMLILLTVFALATINMSSVNLKVMGNEQARNESVASGQQAIEQVISTNFPANPQAVNVNVDINGDGTSDYAVNVAKPVCLNSVPIKLVELDVAVAEDIPCFGSAVSGSPGLPLGGTGDSYCSNTQWEVSATTADSTAGTTSATVTIHQGVGQRVPKGTTC
jgi:PilX N-terminal